MGLRTRTEYKIWLELNSDFVPVSYHRSMSLIDFDFATSSIILLPGRENQDLI